MPRQPSESVALSASTSSGRQLLIIVTKIITINPLNFDRPLNAYTNVVLNHQLGQLIPIDQNDFLRDFVRVLDSALAEGACRNKNALRRPLSYKCSRKLLNSLTANRIVGCVSLRLYVDDIKT